MSKMNWRLGTGLKHGDRCWVYDPDKGIDYLNRRPAKWTGFTDRGNYSAIVDGKTAMEVWKYVTETPPVEPISEQVAEPLEFWDFI